MDTCFNSHALRQFEADEAANERRIEHAEDMVMFGFHEDMLDQDKVASLISDYDIDLSPLLALIFKPLADTDLAPERIKQIRQRVATCFHRYLAEQIEKELDQ